MVVDLCAKRASKSLAEARAGVRCRECEVTVNYCVVIVTITTIKVSSVRVILIFALL